MRKNCLAFIFCICIVTPGQTLEKPEPNHDKIIKHYDNWLKNISNPDYWKDLEMTHKETQKKFYFKDLQEDEKQVFYLLASDKLKNKLQDLMNQIHEEIEEDKEIETVNKVMPKADEVVKKMPKIEDNKKDIKTLKKNIKDIEALLAKNSIKRKEILYHILSNKKYTERERFYFLEKR